MNVHALIALIATVAYIPLFVVMLSNKPWNTKQRVFFLFLIPAILWSLVGFFGRTDFFMWEQSLAVRLTVCVTIWMLIHLHYFVCTFYQSERIKIPWAYIFLVSTIALAALGHIPRDIEVTTSGIIVDYGPWIIAIGFLFLSTVGVKDIYSLLRRHKTSADASERNQIAYLIAAIVILTVSLLAFLVPGRGEYPVGHIGTLSLPVS